MGCYFFCASSLLLRTPAKPPSPLLTRDAIIAWSHKGSFASLYISLYFNFFFRGGGVEGGWRCLIPYPYLKYNYNSLFTKSLDTYSPHVVLV